LKVCCVSPKFLSHFMFHYQKISKVKYKHTIDLLCLSMDLHKCENIMQKLLMVKNTCQKIFKINIVKFPKTSIQPILHNLSINKLSQVSAICMHATKL
jgi:hypothetical protein